MSAPAESPPETVGNDPPGSFPDLEVGRLLGRGGMGAVYEARQTRLDRTVALKVLPPELRRDAAFAGRFRREAKALAKLGHPSIVTVFDFGAAPPGDDGRDGPFYLVMEFVDGPDLRAVLRRDPRPSPAETLAIVRQIGAALDYAHGRGVVHRDVKPENVLLSRDGTVKLADFGLAKLAGPEDASAADAPTTLTRAGQVMGTPQYMAPEQLTGGAAVDHRADLYAVGVLLYELLTGALPLGRYEPPSVRADVPAGWDAIVHRALEVDPAARYPTAAALLADLDRLAAGEAGGTASVGDAGPGLITGLALDYEKAAARAGRPVEPLEGWEKPPVPVPFSGVAEHPVKGRVHLESDELLLEWESGWFKPVVKTLRVPTASLLGAECGWRWFDSRLILTTRRAEDWGELPGASQGRGGPSRRACRPPRGVCLRPCGAAGGGLAGGGAARRGSRPSRQAVAATERSAQLGGGGGRGGRAAGLGRRGRARSRGGGRRGPRLGTILAGDRGRPAGDDPRGGLRV